MRSGVVLRELRHISLGGVSVVHEVCLVCGVGGVVLRRRAIRLAVSSVQHCHGTIADALGAELIQPTTARRCRHVTRGRERLEKEQAKTDFCNEMAD